MAWRPLLYGIGRGWKPLLHGIYRGWKPLLHGIYRDWKPFLHGIYRDWKPFLHGICRGWKPFLHGIGRGWKPLLHWSLVTAHCLPVISGLRLAILLCNRQRLPSLFLPIYSEHVREILCILPPVFPLAFFECTLASGGLCSLPVPGRGI